LRSPLRARWSIGASPSFGCAIAPVLHPALAGNIVSDRRFRYGDPEAAALAAPTAADQVNSSAGYGFIFDFCSVEIDRETGEIAIDNYVSLHDAGHILNPALFDGQVQGGFAMAVGAALSERFVYAENGDCLTGSFADYAVPRAAMVPDLAILNRETASPVTPLGAKGAAEGNSMSTPACIANAVADALGGDADVTLPVTPPRVLQLLRRAGVSRDA
jgi:2-furoyl-CoA dehydrogenase large subunit